MRDATTSALGENEDKRLSIAALDLEAVDAMEEYSEPKRDSLREYQ